MTRRGWRAWAKELGSFWQERASATGLHHFGESQEEHARLVSKLASRHWRRIPWPRIRHDRAILRSFLLAARLHDSGKAFDRENHDAAGFFWLRDYDPLAAYLILRHMGRWRSEGAEVVLASGLVDYYEAMPWARFLAETLQGLDFSAATCYDLFKF